MANSSNSYPSFFKFSYVLPCYSVIENDELENDRIKSENIFTDYDSRNYLRIMKRYDTPSYKTCDPKEKRILNDPTQKTFFLRFYLPKSKIHQKDPKNRIDHLVLMFNGLNEIDRYDVYDQLGAQFAEKGIASVLIPTPLHLNRRKFEDVLEDGKKIRRAIKPHKITLKSGMESLFYYNFRRSVEEALGLIERIKKPQNSDLGFYDNYFSPNLKFSIFGFSLGGLRALGTFLSNPSIFHSCITLNTAANPFGANLSGIKITENEWKQIEIGVTNQVNEMKKQPENTQVLEIFEALYLTKRNVMIKERLKDNSHKFLMITGAGDKTNRTDAAQYLAEKDHGLNQYIIAGVDHVPTLDEKWHHWFPMVGESIVLFMKNCDDNGYSHEEIEKGLSSIINNTSFFKNIKLKYKSKRQFEEEFSFTINDLQTLLSEVELTLGLEPCEKLLNLYYVSKVYYPKFPELLAKIISWDSRS